MSAITESARDEMCQIRIRDVCTFDRATTVWAHANGSAAGKGMWMKAQDYLGAYACGACHDVYDRRRKCPPGVTPEMVKLWFWEGHARSLIILEQKGLLHVGRRVKVAA